MHNGTLPLEEQHPGASLLAFEVELQMHAVRHAILWLTPLSMESGRRTDQDHHQRQNSLSFCSTIV